MNKKFIIILLMPFLFSCVNIRKKQADNILLESFAQKIEDSIQISAGEIHRYLIQSQYIDSRYVDVWLPKDYTERKRYAVLYMNDGQMLFDGSHLWNSTEWGVDETISCLIDVGEIRETIVVGIWHNNNKRHLEYFPQKAIDSIAQPQHDILLSLMPEPPQGDDYLLFLVKELKPFIDRKYSVKKNRENTFIAGSSMGGLISMYAICEYPEVFGGAGCISTHWIGTFENNKEIPEGLNKYLKGNLPDPKTHKLYFDFGTVGLDANYPEYQKMIDCTMQNAGYDTTSWITKVFPGDDHNEKYWSKRLHIPLIFLLEPN